jgi:hypothetical protein
MGWLSAKRTNLLKVAFAAVGGFEMARERHQPAENAAARRTNAFSVACGRFTRTILAKIDVPGGSGAFNFGLEIIFRNEAHQWARRGRRYKESPRSIFDAVAQEALAR